MSHRVPNLLFLLFVCGACSQRPGGYRDLPDSGSADMMTDVDAGPLEVGEPCAGPMDCVEGAMCIGRADGTYVCMETCSNIYDICEGGAVCLAVLSEDAAICYTGGDRMPHDVCASNLDCAPGLLCFGANGQYYCQNSCRTSDSCGPGESCQHLDTGAGLCRHDVGAACVTSGDCQAATSCSGEDAELAGLFPGGYCTNDCVEECPAGSVCRPLPGTSRSLCMATCEHISDCRFNGGYQCLDATACATSSDSNACRNLFGEDSLCVPGPF